MAKTSVPPTYARPRMSVSMWVSWPFRRSARLWCRARFLNRLYVNGFKTLAVGRLRYGVMLREDGFVMDDGTVARLGERDYFISTTTANAAKVLAFAEHLLQTAWRDLKVHVTTVTDQWAAIA